MTGQKLRVAVFPYGSDENPYQRSVRASLEAKGCEVVPVPRNGRFRGLKDLLGVEADLLHLDWMEGTYRGRSYGSSLIKSLATLRDLGSLAVPMVMTVHNLAPHEQPAWKRLDRSVEARLVSQMSGFVHFSRWSREAWKQRHGSSAGLDCIVQHGHYIDDYPNSSTAAEAKAELGLSEGNGQIALCFGGIREYKGYSQFAAQFLDRAPAGVTLVMAGAPADAVESERIERIAGASGGKIRVHLRHINTEEVQFFMNAADIGFVPFRHVNSSGSALLMQSFGLPVAAPQIGALDETLVTGGRYMYEQADQASAIGAALEFAAENEVSRSEVINQMRTERSWQSLARELLSLYLRVLGSSSHVHDQRQIHPQVNGASSASSGRWRPGR